MACASVQHAELIGTLRAQFGVYYVPGADLARVQMINLLAMCLPRSLSSPSRILESYSSRTLQRLALVNFTSNRAGHVSTRGLRTDMPSYICYASTCGPV